MNKNRFIHLCTVAVAIIMISSCGGGSSSTPMPNIQVTDPTPPSDDYQLLFGSVEQGAWLDQTVTITNTGSANLVIGNLASANALAAPFSITADTCSGKTVAPSGSCTATITFSPSAVDSFSDNFDIPSNDTDTPTVMITLSGTGTAMPVPNIVVTDSVAPDNDLQILFGSITQGDTLNKTVTVTNTGTANLVMGTAASANPLAAPFSITADTCSGQTVSPSGTCTVTVRFAPLTVDSFSDSFDIPSNDPDTGTVTMVVTGTATPVPVPNIAVTDSVAPDNDLQIPFGSVTQSNTLSQTVTITNNGSAALVMGSVANANPLAAPFSISADTCSGQTVSPSGACTMTVRFAPATVDSFSDSFDIPSNDPDSAAVTMIVTGTGTPVPVANIAVADSLPPDDDLQIPFGNVVPGYPSTQTVTVTNTGTGDLVIGNVASTNPLAGSFSITRDFCSGRTISPSGSCTVTVRFSPQTIRSFSDSFDIPSNDPETSTITVSVSGTGVTAADPAVNLPDTGQTASYTTTFGEDHDYTRNAPSYAENETGMITDNVTGLMWLKCPAGLSGSTCAAGTVTAYNWYEASGTAHATHNPGGATNVCGGTIFGYSDWRLPTYFEMVTIVDYSRSDPSINTLYFPGKTYTFYWASTEWIAASSTSAWAVDFYVGQDLVLSKQSRMWAVRCVRGQQPISLLQDNSDGTISDNATGLMWQKQDDNVKKDWLGALNYCEGSALAGKNDWRLPNAKELSSIVDHTRRDPAIDPVFTNTKPNYYWTSTTVFGDTTAAWIGTFYGGGLNNLEKKINVSGYVRCVRN